MDKIIKSRTARRYGYLVLVAVLALLIANGVIDESQGDLWKELIYAIFGLGFITAAVNVPEKPTTEEEVEITTLFDTE